MGGVVVERWEGRRRGGSPFLRRFGVRRKRWLRRGLWGAGGGGRFYRRGSFPWAWRFGSSLDQINQGSGKGQQ